MAMYRTVQETNDTDALSGRCDLCETETACCFYLGRTEVRRHYTERFTTIDWWTEMRWDLCKTCSVLVDDHDREALAKRMFNMGSQRDIKAAFKRAALVLEHLNPATKGDVM